MTELSSQLGRSQPKTWDDEDYAALRVAAWKNHGVAMIPIDEVHDPFAKQAIINVAEGFYGRRNKINSNADITSEGQSSKE
jgi:hypothetical protein